MRVTRGEGGGTHNIFGWGCAARSWKPSPYFRPKYMIFHTLFHTWISKCIPYSRPSDVWQIRQLWIDFRRTGLWRPKRCSCFFLRVNVHGSTRCSKNGILYQIDGIYTLFQTNMAKSIPYLRLEMLENDTLWAAYTYMAYMCEYNPLPPLSPRAGCYVTRLLTRSSIIYATVVEFINGDSLVEWRAQWKRKAENRSRPKTAAPRSSPPRSNVCSSRFYSPLVFWTSCLSIVWGNWNQKMLRGIWGRWMGRRPQVWGRGVKVLQTASRSKAQCVHLHS